MATNGRRGGSGKGGKGGKVLESLFGAFLAITLVVALVEGGAFVKASDLGLKPLSDISQLMPGDKDKQKIDNRLNLAGKGTADGTDTATGATPQATPRTDTGDGDTATGDTGKTQTDADGLPAGAASPITAGQALVIARDQLKTATPHTGGYDRASQFGDWAEADGMCGTATTRDLILKRDLTGVTSDPKTCKVLSGTFHDPYTGRTMKFKRGRDTSSQIQIDHVVAVNEAYADGLWKADKATRVRYYNDPDVLIASEGEANNRKSEGVNLYGKGVPNRYDRTWKSTGEKRWAASTPSVWLPSYKPYRCTYMAKRVYVKQKYGLTMSSWEKQETVSYLSQCAAD